MRVASSKLNSAVCFAVRLLGIPPNGGQGLQYKDTETGALT